MMFNYFQGLGIRGFSGNSHLYELDIQKWSSEVLKTEKDLMVHLRYFISVSPLNDLNLTLRSTKCNDTILVYCKKEKLEEEKVRKRGRGQTDES